MSAGRESKQGAHSGARENKPLHYVSSNAAVGGSGYAANPFRPVSIPYLTARNQVKSILHTNADRPRGALAKTPVSTIDVAPRPRVDALLRERQADAAGAQCPAGRPRLFGAVEPKKRERLAARG